MLSSKINFNNHEKIQFLSFFDIETNNTAENFYQKVFLQTLQNAGIVTDLDFNQIESFNEFARPLPYVQVSPGATVINNLADQLQNNQSHYHCLLKRYQFDDKFIKQGPVAFVSWNGDEFDLPIDSANKYQNLLDNFQYFTHGNMHFDLMAVAISLINFHLDYPFPKTEKGNPAYNLNQTGKIFGIENLKAHDAFEDVKVLMKVFENFNKFAPEFLESGFINASKKGTAEMLKSGPCLIADVHYGQHYITPLMHLWSNNDYAITFNLLRALNLLDNFTDEQLSKRISFNHKKDSFIRILKLKPTHSLMRFNDIDNVEELIFKRFSLSIKTLTERFENLSSNFPLIGRLVRLGNEAVKANNKNFENLDFNTSEQLVYSRGFISDHDKDLCKEFHLASSWKDRWKFIRLFKDFRIRDFAWRLCCEHDIENASEKDQEKWEIFVDRRLSDDATGLSTKKSLNIAEDLLKDNLNKDQLYQVKKTKEFILNHSQKGGQKNA